MNELTFQQNFLVGSQDAINLLAEKDHARILTLSDSHGNPEIVKNIIIRYGKTCDAMAFCGDGILDIINILTEAKTNLQLKECLPSVIAFVHGNCDSSQAILKDGTEITFPINQILTVNGQNFLIVHGHSQGIIWGMEKLGLEMKFMQAKTAIYGHTHVARIQNNGEYTFINPGSCASPRDGQPQCFAIITVEKNCTDTLFIQLKDKKGTDFSSLKIV